MSIPKRKFPVNLLHPIDKGYKMVYYICDVIIISGYSFKEVTVIDMPVRSNLRVLHSLREAREGRRITYKEIGQHTGMTEAQISRYMNNNVVMFHAETLDRLCDFYKCEPGDILVRCPEGVAA